jgi:uncharacterized protein (DUF2336 family)
VTASTARFARLIDLAKETSSETRRALLREVTDMFFEGDGAHSGVETRLFDDVLQQVTFEMEHEVRRELAQRFARAKQGPAGFVRRLAHQPIDVAAPVLSYSRALSDADLIEVVYDQGQEHMLAVTKRDSVSEAVSDALVAKGDDDVLAALLSNEGAQMSRAAMETAVDRAQRNERLHAPVVERKALPPDLLNEMYFTVGEQLRARILQRNAQIDPTVLETALSSARTRVAIDQGALPADYAEAEKAVNSLIAQRAMNGGRLAGLLRDNQRTHFLLAFAHMTDLDFATTRRLFEKPDLEAIATACRAAEFDRALFVTIAVLAGGGDRAMGQAEQLGRMYLAVPIDAAKRAIRFWKVRSTSEARTAA